jgi:hypothetical protein
VRCAAWRYLRGGGTGTADGAVRRSSAIAGERSRRSNPARSGRARGFIVEQLYAIVVLEPGAAALIDEIEAERRSGGLSLRQTRETLAELALTLLRD